MHSLAFLFLWNYTDQSAPDLPGCTCRIFKAGINSMLRGDLVSKAEHRKMRTRCQASIGAGKRQGATPSTQTAQAWTAWSQAKCGLAMHCCCAG
eukprot:1138415-Pelagomonas_calceolata.AAC.4